MERNDLETAYVIGTEGVWAKVITNKSSSCKGCGKAEAGICGKGGSGMLIKAKNFKGARAGDTVLLGFGKKTQIQGYFLVFILPVVILFLSSFTGHVLSQSTGIKGLDAAAGLAGLIISVYFSLTKLRRLDRTAELHIEDIVHEPLECEEPGISPEEADYLSAFSRNRREVGGVSP